MGTGAKGGHGRGRGSDRDAGLKVGLFAGLADKALPCAQPGCTQTWSLDAEAQLASLGKAKPEGLCDEHLAAAHDLADREVPCSRPGCDGHFMWTLAEQIKAWRRDGRAEAPSRRCGQCRDSDGKVDDKPMPCRADGCDRTWTWTRTAQLKHRAWVRGGSEGKPRRDEPPRRLCEVCHEKLNHLQEREVVCKVHGCSRSVVVDREAQLRAWVASGSQDRDTDPPLPKRMCEVCREFCRTHPDAEIECARGDCDRTWTYKTGAQLQDFLAGRVRAPVRVCATCSTRTVEADDLEAVEGVEIMPCVVPGCDRSWQYLAGMKIAAARYGELPTDRMCTECRATGPATAQTEGGNTPVGPSVD